MNSIRTFGIIESFVYIMGVLLSVALPVKADLTFTVSDVSSWPNQAHHDAAVNAAQLVVNRYNTYGDFGNYDVYIYYNSGIPTAQASYLGSIGFGGTYPNERVMAHEMAHYLGLPSSGWTSLMVGGVWYGAAGDQLIRQLHGEEEELHGDSIHFWPYGLNYDSENTELNKQRQVAMVYAMRADLGIGSADHPSNSRSVYATASDPAGESGFNRITRWSDGYIPHDGGTYFTADYAIRTPESTNSFTFYGSSFRLNNTTSDGGLLFCGEGSACTITVDHLVLDGGWITHLATTSDVFELAGNLIVNSDSNIWAKQGNIQITAEVSGEADLTIQPTDSPEQNNRYVSFESWNNSFTGNIINNARFELASGANFSFVIEESGVSNSITGGTAMATVINGIFEIDLANASTNVGDSWALVTAANVTYGSSFAVVGFSRIGNVWSNGNYEFDEATGLLTVVPPAVQWAVDGSGLWSDPANWTGGVPAAGDDVVFGDVLTAPNAPASVQLDSSVTINRITFDNQYQYIITGSGTLSLENYAEVAVAEGTHEIAAVLDGSAGLTKTGSGSVILSATNTYSGETNINGGILALSGSAAIPIHKLLT